MKEPNHIMDVAINFHKIINNIELLRKEIVEQSDIDYKSQDARMVALESMQMDLSATAMWIQCLNSLANLHTKQGTLDETEFLKSLGSKLSIELTEGLMFDFLRLGFMTLFHFKMDNLFHNILRHLKALPKKSGYWNLTDEILSQCSISKTGDEKNILTLLAYLRNSLHNNGIHRGKDLDETLDGLTFSFRKGEIVECASWQHIHVLIGHNVEVLEKILLSDKIKAIKDEISDDFASKII